MIFNFEIARQLMVENQLRPNKIKEKNILKIFLEVEKEFFLNDNLKNLAYYDADINLIDNRGYLKNLHIAQLIKYSNINSNDVVLHIGALTGYVTSLLSKLSQSVIAIEDDYRLFNQLSQNINSLKLDNVEIYKSNFKNGYKDKSPYDLILIDNPLFNIPNKILNQLNANHGRLVMIKKINDTLGKCVCLTNNKGKFDKEELFDIFTKFELYKNEQEFIF